jgi:hypothetical protein
MLFKTKIERISVFREPTMSMKINGLFHQVHDVDEKKSGWIKPQVENRDGGGRGKEADSLLVSPGMCLADAGHCFSYAPEVYWDGVARSAACRGMRREQEKAMRQVAVNDVRRMGAETYGQTRAVWSVQELVPSH